MRGWTGLAVACALAVPAAGVQGARAVKMDAREASRWCDYVVPLPRQITITSKVRLPARGIAVEGPAAGAPVVQRAVEELRAVLGQGQGRAADASGLRITLQLGGPDAEPLRALKNNDQAYRITPERGERGLRLTALGGRGLYYASKTLQQLLLATARDGQVDVPMLQVTDWPDLEDRGLWGADSYSRVQWLADRKMNIIEQISAIGIDERGRSFGRWKDGHDPISALGPSVGIKPVPAVLHLEQVSGKGVIRAHPELEGQGGQKGVFCYSKPAIVQVIADWILNVSSQPGVQEVDVWLTENLHGQGGCRCADCQKAAYPVLEARAVIAGWRQACRTRQVGLRVLTSEETEKSNPQILAELPAQVKLWYYHSLLTYTSTERPMVRGYLKESAGQGRWIGMVPSLNTIHFAQPFTSPHFVHARMNEFVDKGMSGLLGYVTPRVYYAEFSVEAAAEWSWNARGRSPRDFARSWAVRRGMKDPDLFAEWAETLGPVTWDVYGSDWPSGEQRSTPAPVAVRLGKGELPELGVDLWGVYFSPWGDIRTAAQLADDVARAGKAMRLAERLGVPGLREESRVVQGYIQSLAALWQLKAIVGPGGIAAKDKPAARRFFGQYIDGMRQAMDALPRWEATLAGEGQRREVFTDKPVGVIRESIERMQQLAAERGIDLAGPRRARP